MTQTNTKYLIPFIHNDDLNVQIHIYIYGTS